MLAVVVAEGVAIALLAVLVVGLLRSHALILRALHELGAGLELEKGTPSRGGTGGTGGTTAPLNLQTGVVPTGRPSTGATDVVGRSVRDEEVSIPVTGSGRRTLIAFLSSGCSVCQTFWDELTAGPVEVPGGARLVVVAKGPEEESLSRLRELAADRLEVVQSSGTWTDYAVPGSPYFVYVDDGTVIGEGSSTSWAQVRDLMGQAVADATDARRVRDVPGGAGVTTSGRDDLGRVDRELLGAGIHPGHPSLYPDPRDDVREEPYDLHQEPHDVRHDPHHEPHREPAPWP
jgi:hypothetical protein